MSVTAARARFTCDCGEYGSESAVNPNHWKAVGRARNGQFRLRRMTFLIGVPAMSQTADAQSRLNSRRDDGADKHALDQAEKWMAMIREISHERQDRRSAVAE
jgi:hypothetical protein